MKRNIKILYLSFAILFSNSLLFSANDYDLQFYVSKTTETEFEVIVQLKRNNSSWDKLGSSNFRFNFNTSGLDNPTLKTAHAYSGTFYDPMTVTDGGSWASVNINLLISNFGTDVSTSWNNVATVHFDVVNSSQTSGLTWDTNNTVAYDDDQSTRLDQGTFSDLNQALPVHISNIMAISDHKAGITVTWQTENEIGIVGYHVWRSENEIKDYDKITASLIHGSPDNLSAHEYSFSDKNISHGVTYWYKIETISIDGSGEFFGPVSAVGILPIPDEFGLSQNYPNPFNPETTIKYQLPEDSKVTIRIYNLLGKQIKELVNEYKQAGYFGVIWNGKDFRDSDVSSGIYLIRIQAGNYNEIRKATILR